MAMASRLAGVAVGAGIGASVLAASLYNVDAGHRGVIYDRIQGVKNTVKKEGTHLLIPFLQRDIVYDVRLLSFFFLCDYANHWKFPLISNYPFTKHRNTFIIIFHQFYVLSFIINK